MKWFTSFLVILGLNFCLAEKPSGFYFDNGMQTEVEFMDLEDQLILRQEILALLGLRHTPEKSVQRIDVSLLGNHTIPHFMRAIYNSLTETESSTGEMRAVINQTELLNNQFQMTESEIRAIEESDIIMSFANHGHQEDLQWTQLFWFDTNELPDVNDEKVIRAELRLFKGEAAQEFDPNEKFIIKCYQLVEGSTGETNLLDSMEIAFKDEGWLILDLTKALKSWQLDYHTNRGLMVEIVRKDDNKIQLHPVAVGLATNREYSNDKDAFMVGYFKNTGESSTSFYQRQRREALDEPSSYEEEQARVRRSPRSRNRKNQRKHKNRAYSELGEDFSVQENVYTDFYGGSYRNKHCQKRMFRVSFRDLGWEDWIIAPDDYEAFYCHGECSFPLSTQMNATNHAIIQTLMHLMSPEDVPKPCCAPTNLSAISVLYFDESSTVILKKYREMVVKSCGCL